MTTKYTRQNILDVNDLISCPVKDCSALPFATQAQLAEHLTTECPTIWEKGQRQEIGFENAPQAPQQGSGSAAPRTDEGATEKQVKFLTALVRGSVATRPEWVDGTLSVEDAEKVVESTVSVISQSKKAASKAIDRLVTDGVKPAWNALERKAPAKPAAPKVDLKHGAVYVSTDGRFIKVAESRSSGNFYGKVWTDEGWIYEGGLVKKIERPVTAEEAAQWGHEHHNCIFCGRNLSDDKEGRSVDVGYGPICADKFGLPWG